MEFDYKLRVYKTCGPNKGNLDHEEYFDSKDRMDERYRELFSHEMYSLNPTAWKFRNGKWIRMPEYH